MTDQYQQSTINMPVGSRAVDSTSRINRDDDLVTVSTASGAIALTLPLARQIPGQKFTIKTDDSGTTGNAVTVLPELGELIDGAMSQTLSADEDFITVQSDGENWRVVSQSGSSGPPAPTTYTDIIYLGREWPEFGTRIFPDVRGYFPRTFSFGAQVIMIAPSSGRLIEVVMFSQDPAGITEVSIFRPGTDLFNPYALVQENIVAGFSSTSFDFSGEVTELVKGERFSIAIEPAAAPAIASFSVRFEWDV